MKYFLKDKDFSDIIPTVNRGRSKPVTRRLSALIEKKNPFDSSDDEDEKKEKKDESKQIESPAAAKGMSQYLLVR